MKPIMMWVTALFLSALFHANAQQQQVDTSLHDSSFAALQFAEALNNKNLEDLNGSFDLQHLGLKVANALLSKENDIKQFMQGFNSTANQQQLVTNMYSAILQQEYFAQYIRMLDEDGVLRPLVRIDYVGGGHEYMILHLTPGNKIGDAFLATTGKLLSDSLIQATSMMISKDESVFGKLFGGQKIDREMMDDFKKIGLLRRQGKIQEAYNILLAMPEEVQNQRIMINVGITLAQALDEQEYRKQLQKLAAHYGTDPSTQFMLVDHYVYTQNQEKTLSSLLNVAERFGMDGAMADLIANVHFEMGNTQKALEMAQQGIDIEPTFEGPYWTLVGIHLEEDNFKEVADGLNLISANLGYEFTPESLAQEPGFDKFRASAAYQEWLETSQ